jgi:hypothetical protein
VPRAAAQPVFTDTGSVDPLSTGSGAALLRRAGYSPLGEAKRGLCNLGNAVRECAEKASEMA